MSVYLKRINRALTPATTPTSHVDPPTVAPTTTPTVTTPPTDSAVEDRTEPHPHGAKVKLPKLGLIGSVNIWKEALLYDELTINERQKSDKTYTDLLDGVRRGFPSQDALELLAQRVLDKPVIEKFNELKDAGKAPICFFPTGKACEEVNTQLLATLPAESVVVKFDNIEEPYNFYIHRQQFPLILAYAVAIQKSHFSRAKCLGKAWLIPE